MINDGYFSEDIVAGMTANTDVSFDLDELSMYGITDIADITMNILVQDDDYKEYATTGPVEIRTSAYDSYDYSKDTFAATMDAGVYGALFGLTSNYSSKDELLSSNSVRSLSEYIVTNDNGEKIALIELVNESGKDLYIVSAGVALNGIIIYSGSWSSDKISAGKKAVAAVNLADMLDAEFYETLGIEDIWQYSCNLIIKDADYNEISSTHIDIPFGTSAETSETGEVLYDSNGLKLFYKGIVKDPSDWSDYYHVLIIVKNKGSSELTIDPDFDGTYVNKIKVDELTYSLTTLPGECGLLDVQLDGDDLDDNGITLDTITDVTIQFEIRDGKYKEVDTPTVNISLTVQ